MKHKIYITILGLISLFTINQAFAQLTPMTIGTLNSGDSIVVWYDVTINSGPTVSNQGTVTATGINMVTDDPDTGAPNDATITPVASLAPLSATFVKTNRSACGATNDGTITVTPAGGTAPYTFSWTGESGSNHTPFTAGDVSSLTGLNYGFYTVTVTDANAASVVIPNIHVQLAYFVFITNSGSISSSCGNTGSIILYGNAGLTPYTYSLDDVTYQAGNTFTNLSAGSYIAYVKDAAGCVSSKPITVGAAAALNVVPFAGAATSCSNDGYIEIYRTGGIPPYTYSLDNITYQTNNKFLNLPAGSYTAWVKDSKGCIGSQAVTVGQGAALNVTASKTNTSSCVNDGTIQVNASGGVTPYTYSLNGGTYQANNSFTGLTNTNYTVSVKDNKGCLGSINVTINLNPIVVTAYSANASSCVASNGVIQLFRTGGVNPYTYSLDGNTYQASSIFTGLTPGTYSGFVKDAKSCVGVLNNIVIGPACLRSSMASAERVVDKGVYNVVAYPNPSNSDFTLLLPANSIDKFSLTVTDVTGRDVYRASGKARQHRFGQDLKAGMYILKIIQGGKTQSIKIIKE